MRFYFSVFCFFILFQFSTNAQGNMCKEDLFPLQQSSNRMWGYVNIIGEWKINAVYTKTFPFNGKTAIFQNGTKFGVINCDGKVVAHADYEEIKPFSGGVAWVKTKDKWGLINENGDILLTPSFNEIKKINHYSSFIWVRKDDLWGVYDQFSTQWTHQPQFLNVQHVYDTYSLVRSEEGKTGMIAYDQPGFVLGMEYDKVVKIGPNIMSLQKNKKWGLISDKGDRLLECKFDTIQSFYKNRLLVTDQKGNALYNYDGKRVSEHYDSVFKYSEGLIRVFKNNNYGFIDIQGRLRHKLHYATASDFCSLKALVSIADSGYTVVDRLAKKVSPVFYQKINALSKRCDRFVIETDSGAFLANETLQPISKTYSTIFWADNTTHVRVEKEGSYNLIAVSDGTPLFTTITFEDIKSFEIGYIIAKKQNRWGVVSTTGNAIIAHQYDDINLSIFNKDVFITQLGANHEVFTTDGKKIIADYSITKPIYVENSIVTLDAKKGVGIWSDKGVLKQYVKTTSYQVLIQENGSSKFPLAVDTKKGKTLLQANGNLSPWFAKEIVWIGEHFYAVNIKGKWSIADLNAIISQDTYDEIGKLSSYYIPVKKEDKWGYINHQMQIRIKPVYDEVTVFYNQYACVRKGAEWFLIDKRGQAIGGDTYSNFEKGKDVFILSNNRKKIMLSLDGSIKEL